MDVMANVCCMRETDSFFYDLLAHVFAVGCYSKKG